MTNQPAPSGDSAAATPSTACPDCASTEFTATESYGLRCSIDDDNPRLLLCKSGDGGVDDDTLECAQCGRTIDTDFQYEFI